MRLLPGTAKLAAAPARCAVQRAFDLVFAILGVGLYGPFWVLASLLILVEDGRPVFFVQERLGKDRVTIPVVKLRTMRGGETTRVGRWLRATGLDESVQFVNVLVGSMRMVGPRPLTAADVDRLGWGGPKYDIRFSVPPGITGIAQLFGGVSARHSFKLDLLYLRRASPWHDAQLLALSFAANVLGKRRVRSAWRRLARMSRSARRGTATQCSVDRGGMKP